MAEDVAGARRDPVDEAARRWAERHPGVEGFRTLTALTRGYAVMARGVEALLRPLGLNLSRFELLMMLSFTRAAGLPMTRIRDLLMVHGSSVTYLVGRLSEAGLVDRTAHPADGRVSLVAITPAGRRLADRAARILAESGFGALAVFEEDGLVALGDLLERLRPDALG